MKKIEKQSLILIFIISIFTNSLLGQQVDNDQCQSAKLINIDSDINDFLLFHKVSFPKCDNQKISQGKWYKFTAEKKYYRLNYLFINNLKIEIFEGTCENLKCVPFDDFDFASTPGKTYFIYINKEINNALNYTFSFSIKPSIVPFNITCFDAKIIQEGDIYSFTNTDEKPNLKYWFQIIGDGKYKKIVNQKTYIFLNYYSGTCDSLALNGSAVFQNDFTFFAEKNKTYIFSIPYGSSQYEFKVETVELNGNFECSNSVQINRDTSIILDYLDYYPHNFEERTLQSLWYSINGNGKIAKVQAKVINSIVTEIYQNKSTHHIQNCHLIPSKKVKEIRFQDDFVTYLNIPHDTIYNFKIRSTPGSKVELRVEYMDKSYKNLNCQNSEVLKCGQSYNLLDLSSSDNQYWYDISGIDKKIVLNKLEPLPSVFNYEIFKGSCNSLKFVDFQNAKNTNIISKNDTSKYYLKVSPIYENINFQTDCDVPKDLNDICNDAKEIFCNDSLNLSSILKYAPIAWFKLKGNDKVWEFDNDNNNIIYEFFNGSCDNLNPLPFEQKFFALTDSVYFVKATFRNNTSEKFKVKVKCHDYFNNDICKNSLLIDSSMTIRINPDQFSYDHIHQNCTILSNNLIWFKIKGNDKAVKLSGSAEFYTFSGGCDSLYCVDYGHRSLIIHSELEKELLIGVSLNWPVESEINFTFFDKSSGILEAIPKRIDCGDYILPYKINGNLSEIITSDHTLWYELIGKDKQIEIIRTDTISNKPLITIFDKEQNIPLYTGVIDDTLNFITEKNKVYILKVDFINQVNPSYYVICKETTLCSESKILNCGERKTLEIKKSEGTLLINSRPYKSKSIFSIEGNGKLIYIKSKPKITNLIEFDVLSSKDCAKFTFIGKFDKSNFIIDSEIGYTYYFVPSKIIYDSNIEFQIECVPNQKNDRCDLAHEISDGKTFKFLLNSSLIDSLNFMHGAPSPGLWLKFLGTGHAVSFIFKSNNHNDNDPGRIYVYKGKCGELNLEDFGNFNNSLYGDSYSFLTQEGLTYYIFINLNYIDLEFEIRSHGLTANGGCGKSKKIRCGEEIENSNLIDNINGSFYIFEGTGELIKFSFENGFTVGNYVEVYEGKGGDKCELILYDQKTVVNKFLYIATKKDIIYFIKIAGSKKYFKFNISCVVPNSNNICKRAIDIKCDQQIKCNIQKPLYGSIQNWYKLPNVDATYILQQPAEPRVPFIASIWEGDCDSSTCVKCNFECKQTYSEMLSPAVFYSKAGRNYFLVIEGEVNWEDSLSFNLKCIDHVPYNFCETATPIECNSTITIKSTHITNEFSSACKENITKDAWFFIKGDGKSYIFNLLDNVPLIAEIYRKSECHLIQNSLITSLYFNSNKTQTFTLESEREYMIRFFMPVNIVHDIKIEFFCNQTNENNDCNNSKKLQAGIDNFNFIRSDFLTLQSSQCNMVSSGVRWYNVDGNDSIFYFQNVSDKPFFIKILKNNCEILECLATRELNQFGFIKFFINKGEKFKILTYLPISLINENYTYKYFVNFVKAEKYNFCQNENLLNCEIKDKKYVINTNLISPKSVGGDNTYYFKYSDIPKVIEIKYNEHLNHYLNCNVRDKCNFYGNFNHNFNSNNTLRFTTDENTDYIFEFSTLENIIDTSSSFTFSCKSDFYTNNNKSKAIPLECKTYNVDFRKVFRPFIFDCPGVPEKSIYYSFTGNGGKLNVDTFDSSASRIQIIDEDCNVLTTFQTSTDHEFETVAGKKYFLIFTSGFDTTSKFTIKYNCLNSIDKGNFNEQKIKIFPNPLSGDLNLYFDNYISNYTIEICNIFGNIVYKKIVGPGTKELLINEESIPKAGMYYVKLTNQNNLVMTKSFIKL